MSLIIERRSDIIAFRSAKRVLPFEEMMRTIHNLPASIPRIGMQGVWDIRHGGYDEVTETAREIVGSNGLIVVFLEPDESVRRNKGPRRPINNALECSRGMAGLREVDLTAVYPIWQKPPSYEDPDTFLPRYLALAEEGIPLITHIWDPNLEEKRIQAERTGLELITITNPPVENSTTRMLKLLGYE